MAVALLSDEQILVVNSGSSSLKLSLFSGTGERLRDAHLKNRTSDHPSLEVGAQTLSFQGKKSVVEGLSWALEALDVDASKIKRIGHRFVHGGTQFFSTTRLDTETIAKLEKTCYLAPLHNKACLEGIEACFALFGGSVLQYAVFDTAFHTTLPLHAATYAIPASLAHKHAIKRYGFHGISHAFLWQTYAQECSPEAKIITAHLGNGCSMTAIDRGTSLDTSMGFSPTEGLLMATRSGDIDPTIVEFLCQKEKKTVSEITQLLHFQSGLLGVSGISSSMETLLGLAKETKQAQLAVDMFCYRVQKYLGAYQAVLQGAEAFIFSGGIGENSPQIRKQIAEGMQWYGVMLDEEANEQAVGLAPGSVQKVSTSGSSIALYVIATDENLYIAQEAGSIS